MGRSTQATTGTEQQTTPNTRVEIEQAEDLRQIAGAEPGFMVHFSVAEGETGTFVGDFSVTYCPTRGGFAATDTQEVRAAGGIYADGAKPSTGLLRHCADLASEELGVDIEHHFR